MNENVLQTNIYNFFFVHPNAVYHRNVVIRYNSPDTHTLSLRGISCFLLTIAKRNFCTIGDFEITVEFARNLRFFQRKYFDPFRRGELIELDHNEYSTYGQLNFFKWMIENGIMDYIEKHYNDILQDIKFVKRHKWKYTGATSRIFYAPCHV